MDDNGADKEQGDAGGGSDPDQWYADSDQQSERARCFKAGERVQP